MSLIAQGQEKPRPASPRDRMDIYESLWIHLLTNEAENIKYGDIVRAFNERDFIPGSTVVRENIIPVKKIKAPS